MHAENLRRVLVWQRFNVGLPRLYDVVFILILALLNSALRVFELRTFLNICFQESFQSTQQCSEVKILGDPASLRNFTQHVRNSVLGYVRPVAQILQSVHSCSQVGLVEVLRLVEPERPVLLAFQDGCVHENSAECQSPKHDSILTDVFHLGVILFEQRTHHVFLQPLRILIRHFDSVLQEWDREAVARARSQK